MTNRGSLKIPIKWLRAGPPRWPSYQTIHSSGLDLHAALEKPLQLAPGERRLVPTGIAIALPPGYEAQVRPRSGLALRHGVTLLNSPGTIDSDYRGEIKALLINMGQEPYTIEPGARIAQLIFAPVSTIEWEPVDRLPSSVRGSGGFGSTGEK